MGMPFKLRVNLMTGEVEVTPGTQEEAIPLPSYQVAPSSPALYTVVDDPTNEYFHQMAGEQVVITGTDGGFLEGFFVKSKLPFQNWLPSRVQKVKP